MGGGRGEEEKHGAPAAGEGARPAWRGGASRGSAGMGEPAWPPCSDSEQVREDVGWLGAGVGASGSVGGKKRKGQVVHGYSLHCATYTWASARV